MIRRRRAPAARGAFTILEVILALAIFVGAAAVLSRLLLLGLEFAEHARWHSEAVLLAESRWAELLSGVVPIDQAGTYEVPEGPAWEWSFEAVATDPEGLILVTLEVRRLEGYPGAGISVVGSRLLFEESIPVAGEG